MEGSLAGAYTVLDGPEQSSWTFSIPKVGEPVQHYSLQKIPWHAGLPGDRRQDTSLIGNLTLVGKEHEGSAGEPWTANQTHWSAKIDVAMRALCPQYGKNPPTLRVNTFWHTWLSATNCPSGRNPDNAKFALINEWEDDMAFTAEQKQEIRDIIFGKDFIAKDEQGRNASEPHDLEHWAGILIEHLHAPHGSGDEARVRAIAEDVADEAVANLSVTLPVTK